jgi:signal transduction histidine kinase
VLKFWRSSTARFITLVFGIELILAAGMTLTLRALTRAELENDAKAFAARLTEEVGTVYLEQGLENARKVIGLRVILSEGRSAVVLLVGANGKPLAGNLKGWPPTAKPGWSEIGLYRAGSGQLEQMGVLVTPLPNGAKLLAGQMLESDRRLSGIVDRATGTALIFGLPLALFAAFAGVRIINARVDDIAETARAVSAGRLSQRVSLDGSGDTFDRLGETLNAMLERIEALISELRIVTDGLAHDLRSPLTRLKARLERAQIDDDEESLRTAIHLAGEETDRLLAMLTTALQISRAEAGIGRDHFAPADLGEMVGDIAELYEPLVEDKGFAMEIATSSGPIVPMHRELVGQAVGNLIDNALKYGAKSLRIATGEADGHGWVEISDRGAGIPEEQREEALRRFGRLDPSRTGFGAGLGLSLVSAVARLHGGTIELGDAAPGLKVRLSLPLV